MTSLQLTFQVCWMFMFSMYLSLQIFSIIRLALELEFLFLSNACFEETFFSG